LYINAVPVQFIRGVWSRLRLNDESPLVNLSKGIENRTGEFPAEILRDLAGPKNVVYTLSGPSFAREVYEKKHTAVVLAGNESSKARALQTLLSDETFRVYRNDDLIGVEVAGALKNVIAMGAGIIDGINAGMNSRAAVITRGVAETMRLGRKMGAKESTFLGLAGFGDFILTCTHVMSRNFSFGRSLARTGSVDQAMKEAGGVVEGYFTLKSAVELGHRYGVELPIMDGLYAIIYEGRGIEEVITALMRRDLKTEWGAYSQ
ncbi:MAG TPA: NAD(P)-dependent glycerol-3-phosphate dehydrogenase, partial [Firmicutes bacterium]|nr:NAD(P)-dependent glycerol-3-phosphate dehydrogenase [Bacillota bacterium]